MKAILLMYHSIVTSDTPDPYAVTALALDQQLCWLEDHGYQITSLAKMATLIRQGAPDQNLKNVVLTFDDGYKDFFTHALPVLLRHRATASIFLVLGQLGLPAKWNSSSAELMNISELQILKEHNMSLGSHTWDHRDLTLLNDHELRRQLDLSLDCLSSLGETFLSFSYPWGRYSTRELVAVQEAGYQCAVSTDQIKTIKESNLFTMGRLTIENRTDLAAFGRLIAGPSWLDQRKRQAVKLAGIIRRKLVFR